MRGDCFFDVSCDLKVDFICIYVVVFALDVDNQVKSAEFDLWPEGLATVKDSKHQLGRL